MHVIHRPIKLLDLHVLLVQQILTCTESRVYNTHIHQSQTRGSPRLRCRWTVGAKRAASLYLLTFSSARSHPVTTTHDSRTSLGRFTVTNMFTASPLYNTQHGNSLNDVIRDFAYISCRPAGRREL